MNARLQVKHPYRIFVGYAHKDFKRTAEIVRHLASLGAAPMYDRDILGATPFTREIRWRISCSHIFVCVLTKRAQHSGWVISELGYAMGMGIPVLPLSLNELPTGLAHEIHAIPLKADLSDLGKKLTATMLENIVAESLTQAKASFECGERLRDRCQMLIDETNRVYRYTQRSLRLRQRAAFSSFSIPDEPPSAAVWDDHIVWSRHNKEERQLLRKERNTLADNAIRAGCDLIIDPYVTEEGEGGEGSGTDQVKLRYARKGTITRLKLLLGFLERQTNRTCAVVVRRGQIESNLTILDTWLSAQAVIPHYKGGLRHTVFTRHAPTILRHIEDFDEEFADGLKHNGVSRADSLANAKRQIGQIIRGLETAA